MKRTATLLAAAAILAVAGPASAQDTGGYAGMFSAIADGMGQSVGQAVTGGQSVFVYAQGHAKVPMSASAKPAASAKAETYQVEVAFTASTAVEAAGKRDALLARLQAVAQRFNAGMKTSEVALVLGDPCRRPSRSMAMACMRAQPVPFIAGPAEPAVKKADTPPSAPTFSATADVSFSIADLSQAPAFLDAIHAAGVDSINNLDETSNPVNIFARTTPLAATNAVDEKVWDVAARDAVREARSQAAVLAQADGRDVGDARQILFLARTTDGDEATVTVAVRFDLKH